MIVSPVSFPIKTVNLSPGSHLLVENVSWEQYEALLEELGSDRAIPRINYCDRTLELMSPLPAHERPHRIIADIVKALLDVRDRDWEDFGSTTFKKPKKAGLEADTCLYIKNAPQVRSLLRLNLEIDPPPDLAIRPLQKLKVKSILIHKLSILLPCLAARSLSWSAFPRRGNLAGV